MAVHLVPPSEDTRSGYGFSISILASLPLENPTSSANDRQACNWLGQSGVVQVRPPSCEISMDSHSPSMQRPLSCERHTRAVPRTRQPTTGPCAATVRRLLHDVPTASELFAL